jgi:FkbM family methyltransferase
MHIDINSALKFLNDIFNSNEISIKNKDEIANYILDLSLRAKGYNNSQNFTVTGEEYFFKNILSVIKPRVCLDVGANIGDYSRALLEMTNAQVYAFEPLIEPFNKVEDLKKEFGDRIIPINKGVGANNEYLNIYFNKDVSAHASFSKDVQAVPYLDNSSVESIEVITLDTFFENFNDLNIDFIKIDTEGFEWEVLQGAKNILEKYKPKIIQIEFNWHQLFRSHTIFTFSKILSDYKVFQLLPNGIIERNPKEPYTNIFHFSNFIFIRYEYSFN